MKRMILYSILAIIAIFTFVACEHHEKKANETASAAVSPTQKSTLKKYEFNSQKELMRLDADNYRRWIYVGTPLTPNDMNEPEAAFPEFHNVYIHPDDYDYWERNGKWQDGTILVKELVLVGKKAEVSGKGYFMGDFTGLEVTIKDKKLFPDEPGNWAYFSFGHTYPLSETAKAFPTAACNACHASAADDDFVFTQDYPILKAAKNAKNKAIGFIKDNPFEKRDNNQLEKRKAEKILSFLSEK